MPIPTYHRTRTILRTLGPRRAAGYLRNRGISLETALYWITGRPVLIAKER